jgi:hypothetical protein
MVYSDHLHKSYQYDMLHVRSTEDEIVCGLVDVCISSHVSDVEFRLHLWNQCGQVLEGNVNGLVFVMVFHLLFTFNVYTNLCIAM